MYFNGKGAKKGLKDVVIRGDENEKRELPVKGSDRHGTNLLILQ